MFWGLNPGRLVPKVWKMTREEKHLGNSRKTVFPNFPLRSLKNFECALVRQFQLFECRQLIGSRKRVQVPLRNNFPSLNYLRIGIKVDYIGANRTCFLVPICLDGVLKTLTWCQYREEKEGKTLKRFPEFSTLVSVIFLMMWFFSFERPWGQDGQEKGCDPVRTTVNELQDSLTQKVAVSSEAAAFFVSKQCPPFCVHLSLCANAGVICAQPMRDLNTTA